MKKILPLILLFFGVFISELCISQGHNASSPECKAAIARKKQVVALCKQYCEQNINNYNVPIPPMIDPDCPVLEQQWEEERIWSDSVTEPENRYIRLLIGAEKQCQQNCPHDSCGEYIDGINKLLERLRKKSKIMLSRWGNSRYQAASVLRCVLKIEKSCAMLGYDDASSLAELGSYVEFAYEDAIKRLSIEHDYRTNLFILLGIAKQAAMLGCDINLAELQDKYYNAMLFEMTIEIEGYNREVNDAMLTGIEHKMNGKTYLYLNPDLFFGERIFTRKWEPGEIFWDYTERNILPGNDCIGRFTTQQNYKTPLIFEFLPSCARNDSDQYEVAFEFERFAPLCESMYFTYTGKPEDCAQSPSRDVVPLPDGESMIIEKYANCDSEHKNVQNPIELLIRSALVDTIENAAKRNTRDIKNNISKFTPPTNMSDTAAYNKWMSEIKKAQEEIRQSTNIRFYPTLQNKNRVAVDFTFNCPPHVIDGRDMNVIIKIKLTHKNDDPEAKRQRNLLEQRRNRR